MISILDHGARSGLEGVQTVAIQAALNACAAEGGGTVLVPAGVFFTGTLSLPSYVTLYLKHGATLKDSPQPEGLS